jgi:hypothetical protein
MMRSKQSMLAIGMGDFTSIHSNQKAINKLCFIINVETLSILNTRYIQMQNLAKICWKKC